MPHLRVEETPEARREETWTCAGGNEIKKEGKVTVSWRTDLGAAKRPTFKVGRVSRTLISVDRLQKNRSGCDSHEEEATQCQHEDSGNHVAEKRQNACSFWSCGAGCRRVIREQKAVRVLHGRASEPRLRKSKFRPGSLQEEDAVR